MGIKESIDDTRKGFEESFATGDFYNRQTQDSDHLEKILGFVKISKGMIERITVFEDHLEFEFKCGLETEVQM